MTALPLRVNASESFVLRSGRGLGRVFAFSPDGATVASATGAGVQLIDCHTLREMAFVALTRTAGATFDVRELRFSPDGRWLATAGPGRNVHLIDVMARQERRILSRHRSDVHSVAFSTDGRTWYSAGENAAVVEWDYETATVRRIASHPTGRDVSGVLLSEDGQRLLEVSGLRYRSLAEMNEAKVYDATSSRVLRTLEARFIATDPRLYFRGSWIAVGDQVWDLSRPDGVWQTVRDGDFLALDGQGLALVERLVTSTQLAIELWDVKAERAVARLVDASPIPAAGVFDGEGTTAAVTAGKGGASTWALWRCSPRAPSVKSWVRRKCNG